MDPRAYWVGFNHIRGIGAVRMQKLLQFFGDLSIAWNAPLDGLTAAGLPEKLALLVLENRKQIDPEALLLKIEQKGIRIITRGEEAYPKKLREIDQPPPVLYILGEITPEDDWAVAIVGTRRMTGYGRQVAAELAAFLARRGVTVVSGLARGIDAVAHQAAVHAEGRTLAVLGCGVDVIYPPENRQIYQQISQNGALISDYAPGTAPEGINFPPRNRIISGLSAATVVVEAAATSGALITSNFAVEQGREVFAVPGSIYAAQSKGTNYLIQQGARPLVDFNEILEILQYKHVSQAKSVRKLLPDNEVEAQLLQVMGDYPAHVDEIHVKSGLPMAVVSSTLTLLELKGLVYKSGNMNYAIVREIFPGYGSE
jgi:DNA processing protein